MRFKSVFYGLNGRDALPEEILKFERLTTTLQTTPNDALLAVLVALDHYENLYAGIPDKISKSAADTLAKFRLSADAQAHAAMLTAKSDMAKAVAAVAKDVATATARNVMIDRVAICTSLALVCFGVFGYEMHHLGYNAGYGVAYKDGKNEQAAAAWANTPEGQLAYKLAQDGELTMLAKCKGTGWKVVKGICYPYPVKEGTYGWKIPGNP